MFKLDLEPTFETTVKIPRPGGEQTPVRVTFFALDEEAYRQAFEETRSLPGVELVTRLVKDWRTEDDPQGAWQGMPAPYSADVLRDLARRQPRAPRAFIDHYLHEMLGLPLKN